MALRRDTFGKSTQKIKVHHQIRDVVSLIQTNKVPALFVETSVST